MAPALLSLDAGAWEHAAAVASVPFTPWPRYAHKTKLDYFFDASEALFPAASLNKLLHKKQLGSAGASTSFLEAALPVRHTSFKLGAGTSFLVELPGSKLRSAKYTSFTGDCARAQGNNCCDCCSKTYSGNDGAKSDCERECWRLDNTVNCDKSQKGGSGSDDDFKECTELVNDEGGGGIDCCDCCNSSDKKSDCQGRCNQLANVSCPALVEAPWKDCIRQATNDGNVCCQCCRQNHGGNDKCYRDCNQFSNGAENNPSVNCEQTA